MYIFYQTGKCIWDEKILKVYKILWIFLDGNASKKVETYEDLIEYRSSDNRNIKLVAEWKPIEYTITYVISPISKKTAAAVTTKFSDTADSTETAILINRLSVKDTNGVMKPCVFHHLLF